MFFARSRLTTQQKSVAEKNETESVLLFGRLDAAATGSVHTDYNALLLPCIIGGGHNAKNSHPSDPSQNTRQYERLWRVAHAVAIAAYSMDFFPP